MQTYTYVHTCMPSLPPQEKPSTRDLSSVIVLILRFLEDFAQVRGEVCV